VESYWDYFLIGTKDIETGQAVIFSTAPEIVGGHPIRDFRAWFDQQKTESIFQTINGHHYDNHMMRLGYDGETDPAVFKTKSEEIINGDEFIRPRKQVNDELHCDLLAMHGGMEQVAGSKEMAIKGNLKSVRESPVSFDAPTTTDDEKRSITHVYNEMDLQTIAWAFNASRKEIDARLSLMEKFPGINVLSEPDSSICDQIFRQYFCPTGKLIYPGTDRWTLDCAKLADKFVYHDPEAIALQARLRQVVMQFKRVEVVEKGRTKKKIEGPRFSEALMMGGYISFIFGKGGLHSKDEPGFYVSDDRRLIRELDFKSDYPHIILHHKLCPPHLPKAAFLRKLRELLDLRMAARDTDPVLSEGLKIACNSVFGKTGSAYSWLLDPPSLFSCTILGQLQILAMVDLLVAVPEHVEVLSVNTDSVTYRVAVEVDDVVMEACNELAAIHGQSLGWVQLGRIVRRDINNYIAVGIDGRIVKAKGAYQYRADKIKGKAVNQICIDAVQQFFINDTPIADTVMACTNITKFIDYRKTTKGYVLADDQGGQYGGVARWYIGLGGVHLDTLRVKDGSRSQVVAKGAVMVPDLPETMPDDVDYQHYIAVATAMVTDITDPPIKGSHTIPLAELSKVQRDLHFANSQTMAPDIAQCGDLTRYANDYAAVYKGNPRDSMKGVLLRKWWGSEGAMTHGDLLYCALALDEPVGYFTHGSKARNLEQMVEWIAHDISPFPKARSTEECANLALTWAKENVAPCKVRRKMKHTNAVIGSTYLNNEALQHFAKTRNEYKLACKIAAAMVKHLDDPEAVFIVGVINDVRAHVTKHPDLAEPQTVSRRLLDQARWDYYSTDLR
jgi:hypothetical protein